MSHSLGGFLDLPHGLCNSLLLEHVVAYNFEAAPERFTRIAETLGIDCRGLNHGQVKVRLLDHLIELKRAVGLTGTLGRVGVSTSDVPFLARHALEDPCILTNPRRSGPRDVQVVYEEAL
ncbi:iron-containing alcohol dehydrogenase [Billgrantia tianxiuensis]|uniref:iron-containing alcohol dehydrogenase n=2 Tax=Halomonadaceae TaxID=28256 RepID=UPI002414339C|nr:iron-containing alcohol dehydrogenase [Halomonas tianxiuensis]